MAATGWNPSDARLPRQDGDMVPVGATEHTASPTRDAAPGGRPTLCPGCHNHPSLRLPWAYLPEKVAADIDKFIDQLHSLYHKGIIDECVYDKLYEHAANRWPPTFCTLRTLQHCPPLWINYHNVKTSTGFVQIGCTRCMRMTPQLWIKGSQHLINEIGQVLHRLLSIHGVPGGAAEHVCVLPPPFPPACSTQSHVSLPPPPPPPSSGRAGGASERTILFPPPPPPTCSRPSIVSPPPPPFVAGGAGGAAEHTFVLPPPPSLAGCTGGALDDAVRPMASSRVESDVAHLECLIDPLKMSSLVKDETHTEPKAEGPLANVARQPILGQLEPVPPPTGRWCICRKHWANLELHPSYSPAELPSYELAD